MDGGGISGNTLPCDVVKCLYLSGSTCTIEVDGRAFPSEAGKAPMHQLVAQPCARARSVLDHVTITIMNYLNQRNTFYVIRDLLGNALRRVEPYRHHFDTLRPPPRREYLDNTCCITYAAEKRFDDQSGQHQRTVPILEEQTRHHPRYVCGTLPRPTPTPVSLVRRELSRRVCMLKKQILHSSTITSDSVDASKCQQN